ncbi:MAG: TonB family protein [Nitrospina sp.]|nr:TonB family protein [Nitrospina sp.]
MLKPKLTKPVVVSALGSFFFHMVFAVTAGAYFLTREVPPVKNEVRVKIIEKEKPDRKEKREMKAQPVVEVMPVMQPKELVQPVTPQQAVQVASAQKMINVEPVMMEPPPTNAAPPKTARVTSHVTSRAMTASASTPRPLRSTPVATVASSRSSVKKHSNVSVVTVPNPAQVMQPTTVPQSVVTASKTGIRKSRAVGTVASTPAPKSVSAQAPSSSGRAGTSMHRSAASTAPLSSAPAPMAVASASTASGSGKSGASIKSSSAKVAHVQGLTPLASPPGLGTDPDALDGYQSGIHRRLAFIAKKHYKRSSAKRANKEGKVLIAFTLLRNGEIKDPYVKEANPHPLINQAAMEALKKAAPFDEFPEEILENELQLVIPFSFTLR